MTTQAAALYGFFAGFGIPAYSETSVPDDVEMPYLTYESIQGTHLTAEQSISANLWYYGSSEKPANDKATEISKATAGGVLIGCDGGGLVITQGSPWCQSVKDDNNMIKRRLLNFTVESLTNF
jgi:hypothetical protein